MGTEIHTWQVLDGKLQPIESALKTEGRTEPYDLEPWIESRPEIIGSDILLIGRQVVTKSGPIDLLGLDRSGNTVIVELKRDKLPREVLAQAIDYASDVATWTVERLGEISAAYFNKPIADAFSEAFPDVDAEAVSINSAQRIILVGFSIDAALERMIEWLSEHYSVSINAIILHYVKTRGGDELLTRTSVIAEEVEQERSRKQKKFEIQMSDEPGSYDRSRLKELLRDYLGRDRVMNRRMRDIFFPSLLKSPTITRGDLRHAFATMDPQYDETKFAGHLPLLSTQLGLKKNDFLRQVVSYGYPKHRWEKDNFSLRPEYRSVVEEVLNELAKHS